ncbi:MAG: type VI secretion system baseplate subunit TssF [Polyangiaceae bacterium]|nr:type VI secretion system baseplate subunit TssF [Polyangiaceae bacterium]
MARDNPESLQSIENLAESFARAYPALAPHLSERSSDPDVEHLLEAFALLSHRIHRIIDGSSSASAVSFGELLSPELVRPFPAATILEIEAPSKRISVPEGAEFDSLPVEGTHCRFRASAKFALTPWTVENAIVNWSPNSGQTLNITLRISTQKAPENLFASLFPLRLHLTGDSRVARTLVLFLRHHLQQIELEIGKTVVAIRKESLRAWGLAPEEALLPCEPFEHHGLRLLREYFMLPAKYAFVEIMAPSTPISDSLSGSAVTVTLRFRFDTQLPLGLQITADNVRLNCVPVVNVFETTTNPVRPTLQRPEHLLRPAALALAHGETYAVRRVLARVRGDGIFPVASWSEFEAAPPECLPNAFFIARTAPATAGPGNDVHLSLGTPADAGVLPEVDFLSIEIWATNGMLPSALGIGDVCVPTETSPCGLTFRNVSAVTPYRPPARGSDLHWRTLALTTLSALPLTSEKTLKTLVHVLNLHPIGDAQAARTNAQRTGAILEVDAKASTASFRQSNRTLLVRGYDVTVRLDASGFDGEGDALLFATVLAHLFAHEASLNTFVRTTVRIVDTGHTFAFPALHAGGVLEAV